MPPGELDPDLARALGIDEQDGEPEENARNVITPDMGPAHLRLARSGRGEIGTVAGLASQQSLDRLLREGRAEFREYDGANKIWTPHRPPRPEKSEGGHRLVIKSEFDPKGDQPQAIADLVEGVKRNDRTQVLLGVTGSGKTFTIAKVIEETSDPHLFSRPTRRWRRSSMASSRISFPTTRSNISSPITTTISRKRISRAPTPISRRIPRSTSRSTACAIRRRGRCLSATT